MGIANINSGYTPYDIEKTGVHLYFARAKHFGRQFISENQRFTAEMLRPYEYICKNEMHPETALPFPYN